MEYRALAGAEPTHGPNDSSCIGNDVCDPKNPPVHCNGNLMPALDSEGYKHWLGALVPEGPVQGGSDPGLLAVMKKVGPAIWLGHWEPDHRRPAETLQPGIFYSGHRHRAAGSLQSTARYGDQGCRESAAVQYPRHQPSRPGGHRSLFGHVCQDQCRGRRCHLSLAAKLPKSAIFDRIPQAGIWGNDHIMMWNTNSDQIADLVLKWIEKHIEKKKVKTPW